MSRDRHACRSIDEHPQQFLKRRDRHLQHGDASASHRVFLRGPKLTSDCPWPHQGAAIDQAGVRAFVPQQRARKNYIGIVCDTTEDERIADAAARLQPRVVGDLVGRLAAVLGCARKDAPGRTSTD